MKHMDLKVLDTSKVEFEWRLIEPDGTETLYPGFYAAVHGLLDSPGIGQLMGEAMYAAGIFSNKSNAQDDWLWTNAEEFVAEHGYSLECVRKS